jgi:hypothetical protein
MGTITWVRERTYGANPIVARVLLQGLEILNGAVFAEPFGIVSRAGKA